MQVELFNDLEAVTPVGFSGGFDGEDVEDAAWLVRMR